MALNEQETPVNNIGGGMIQGAGVGPQGEPGKKLKLTGLQRRRYKGFKEFTNGQRRRHES